MSGCSAKEPNNIAYVVAVGMDKGNDGNYETTIQFARTDNISGGASEEGGKGGSEIIENVSVEAPDLYSAISLANSVISKEFSLAHAKIIVFSKEVAKGGINPIIETFAKSDEIRPDIILAVSDGKASEYLENIKPLVELNPTKYYQLIYETNNFGGSPKITAQEVYFNIMEGHHDSVMPLAGVLKASDIQKEIQQEGQQQGGEQGQQEGQQQGGQQGGQEEQQQGGQQGEQQNNSSSEQSGESPEGQSSSGEDSSGSEGEKNQSKKADKSEIQDKIDEKNEIPINTDGFQYKMRDYKAGEVAITDSDKSESLGMVVFKKDKMAGELGEKDAEIYNMLNGTYPDNYVSFYSEEEDNKTVTVKLHQYKAPSFDIDRNNKQLTIKLYLESDLYSMPEDFDKESKISKFEQSCTEEINKECERFVTTMRDDYDSDVLGIGGMVKKQFLDMKSYDDYNWNKEFKNYSIKADTKFKIKHSGMTVNK